MTVVVDVTVTAIVMNVVADVTMTVTAIVMNVVADVTMIVTAILMTVGIGKSLWKSALKKSALFLFKNFLVLFAKER
ncbi:hypothetical protein P4T74_30380 [Bacillus mycoides]|nr:hypothetical protein [Bacillus mycoides]MDR4905054.1 hypothetical protein [Bacillus mycoides]MED1054566.1 hypothetical protein [Bacillus mycoides]